MPLRTLLLVGALLLSCATAQANDTAINAMVVGSRALELAEDRQLSTAADGKLVNAVMSPDGKNVATVVNRQRLEIRPAVGGPARTFVFNREDRPFVDDDCVDWLDNRYLSFFNPYPIVIDTDTMKMHYLLASDLVPDDVIFSPDFKCAAVVTGEGMLLAPIVQTNGQ